jgi:hypothetical protein
MTQILKNKNNIDIINSYIADNKLIKSIIIRGPIGCGKLTLIKYCLTGINYYIFDTDNDVNILDRFINLCQYFSKIKAIIITNIDENLKNSIKTKFYKYIANNKNKLPLIFITSADISIGTTREVPKCIKQLHFELPNISDIVKLGTNISKEMKVNISKNAIEKLAGLVNFDLRQFNIQIKNFSYLHKKITIKDDLFYTFNPENLDTFQSLNYCADSSISWKNKLNFSSSYTNSTLFHIYPNISKKNMHTTIIDLICLAEEIRNHSYTNQDWDTFENYYCIIGTIIPMYFIGTFTKKLTYPPSITVQPENFENIEIDSILVSNNFNHIGLIEDPVKATKLAFIDSNKRIKDSKLKELKKIIS